MLMTLNPQQRLMNTRLSRGDAVVYRNTSAVHRHAAASGTAEDLRSLALRRRRRVTLLADEPVGDAAEVLVPP
jgi:hypothetical protein